MLSTLHKILKHSLCLTITCVLFSTSALARQYEQSPLLSSPPASPGKKIDLGNHGSSSQHYYSKIQLLPTNNLNNPACTGQSTGMLAVDTNGILYICNGGLWENVSSPWDIDGKIIYPKDFQKAQVAIGSNAVPLNPPGPPDVKFYLSQRNASGLNQIEFKPTDRFGNVNLEMYTGGVPLVSTSGNLRTSTYFNFLVGNRGRPWDARIEYFYNSATVSGLKFIGQRKTLAANANAFPDLKLYADGRVDFGSDETSLTGLPPLPARHATRKVKVYGNTKADTVILNTDGAGPNRPALLKVKYVGTGTPGYYAVYSP